jgi:hypothetical protein
MNPGETLGRAWRQRQDALARKTVCVMPQPIEG